MGENYYGQAAGVASGTDKTILALFNAVATPTRRASIYEILVGSVATPADQAAKFTAGRITTITTEGSGFTPVALDGTIASECDFGVAYSSEPTYTANKQLLQFSINQRATFRWVAAPGKELRCAATQNNGIGLKTASSTSTQAHEACIFFEE